MQTPAAHSGEIGHRFQSQNQRVLQSKPPVVQIGQLETFEQSLFVLLDGPVVVLFLTVYLISLL